MNTKIYKKFIAAFLAILLVTGVVAPLAEPIAAANDDNSSSSYNNGSNDNGDGGDYGNGDDNGNGGYYGNDDDNGYYGNGDDNDITDYFKNDNFKNAVRKILELGPSDYILASVVAEIEDLNVSSRGISDLAGIEHFTGLKTLDVSDNNLTSLDVSKSPNLRSLSAAANDILYPLTLGDLSYLETLDLSGNRINSLDLEGFYALKELNLSNNAVTPDTLTLGTHPDLETLNLSRNRLTTFDVSTFTELKNLDVSGNTLTAITFGAHPYLETLDLSRNGLATLDVSEFTALQTLHADRNTLTTITFGTHTYLETLNLSRNLLDNLNVSTVAALKNLDASGNILTQITLDNLPNLETLNLSDNRLATLNISGSPALQIVEVFRNNLTTFTMGNHPYMLALDVSSNQLTTLDVSRVPTLRSLRAWRNNLATIDVSNLSGLSYLDVTRNYFRAISAITGLGDTRIELIIEGEHGLLDEEHNWELGFFFFPQNVDVTWPFDDVLPRDWFYDYVFWAFYNDITTGFRGTNEFRPRNPVTRGQFATFLYRIADQPAVSGGHGFSDVPAGRYFTIPVTWAVGIGVTTGFTGTTEFRPTIHISREQIATMLHRYAGEPAAPANALDDFIDNASVSSWARNAMRWAVHNGIIQGNRSRLLPQDNASRAETVAMLYRVFG